MMGERERGRTFYNQYKTMDVNFSQIESPGVRNLDFFGTTVVINCGNLWRQNFENLDKKTVSVNSNGRKSHPFLDNVIKQT